MSGITRDGTRHESVGTGERTVILVHGLGLTRAMWQWQTVALAARYRVITYDLFGHGDSVAAPQKPSLAVFSQQLLNLIDELGLDRVAVLGFSLGGMIARRFAMDAPGRLWALGILHSAHRRERAAQEAIQARVIQSRTDGPQGTVEAALSRWLSDDFRAQNLDIVDFVRRSVLANKKELYPDNYQVLVDGVEELIAPDPPIMCPTLVLTGDEDFGNSPAMAHAIAAEIPKVRTVILNGLRHLAMIEAPALFNAHLLAFLADVEQGRFP